VYEYKESRFCQHWAEEVIFLGKGNYFMSLQQHAAKVMVGKIQDDARY
jgi:hypothetical protein